MGVIPARSIKSDVFSKPFPFYYFFTRAKFDKPLNRRAIIAGVDDRWTGFYVRWIARAWVIFMLVFVFIIGLQGMFQDPPDDYYNVVVERACAECRLPDACPIATEVEGEDLAMCEEACSKLPFGFGGAANGTAPGSCNFAYLEVEPDSEPYATLCRTRARSRRAPWRRRLRLAS